MILNLIPIHEDTPLANLWLTQAHASGFDLHRFADSTGTLDELIA